MVYTRSWINILYVDGTYTFMNVNICMDIVQTRLYSFTTTLHFPSGPISFATPASLQVSSAQAPLLQSSLLLVISLHVHTLYIRSVHTSLFILVCTWCRHVCTWFISVHPVQCLYMVHLGSSWFTSFCWKRFLDVRRLYSHVLSCTTFKQCYGTGISHLVQAGFIQVCTP